MPSGSILCGVETDRNASQLIDERIEELGDWRGETLARISRR
jgi:hypothetical protein